MSDSSNPKPTYEPPIVISLGGLIQTSGQQQGICINGQSPTGSCNTGYLANGTCHVGANASPNCGTGSGVGVAPAQGQGFEEPGSDQSGPSREGSGEGSGFTVP